MTAAPCCPILPYALARDEPAKRQGLARALVGTGVAYFFAPVPRDKARRPEPLTFNGTDMGHPSYAVVLYCPFCGKAQT